MHLYMECVRYIMGHAFHVNSDTRIFKIFIFSFFYSEFLGLFKNTPFAYIAVVVTVNSCISVQYFARSIICLDVKREGLFGVTNSTPIFS